MRQNGRRAPIMRAKTPQAIGHGSRAAQRQFRLVPTGAALSVFRVNGLVGFAVNDLDAIGGAGFRRRYD